MTGTTGARGHGRDLLISAPRASVDGGSLKSLRTIIAELAAAIGTTPADHKDLIGVVGNGTTTAISRLNANAAQVDKSMLLTSKPTAQIAMAAPRSRRRSRNCPLRSTR